MACLFCCSWLFPPISLFVWRLKTYCYNNMCIKSQKKIPKMNRIMIKSVKVRQKVCECERENRKGMCGCVWMCVWMPVNVCVWICVCECVYVNVRVNVCVCACGCMWMCVWICVCGYVCVNVCVSLRGRKIGVCTRLSTKIYAARTVIDLNGR